ncbi:hypothetical protein [Mycolicibacterium elephantis]|nr:hypothetical protein [Mycolicibacterium elephantis]
MAGGSELALVNLVMMRKQLLVLKKLAERDAVILRESAHLHDDLALG